MTNPIKAFRQWRERRRDTKLRKLCLNLAIKENCYGTFESLHRAHTYYLYLKNGVSEDGVTMREIFQKTVEEVNRPIKL